MLYVAFLQIGQHVRGQAAHACHAKRGEVGGCQAHHAGLALLVESYFELDDGRGRIRSDRRLETTNRSGVDKGDLRSACGSWEAQHHIKPQAGDDGKDACDRLGVLNL